MKPCWVRQVRALTITPPTGITSTRSAPMEMAARSPKVTPKRDIDFEGAGAVIGGIIAAGLYLPTLPVVFIDGPIPVVDAGWLLGLGWATTRGAALGSKYGRIADELEDLL